MSKSRALILLTAALGATAYLVGLLALLILLMLGLRAHDGWIAPLFMAAATAYTVAWYFTVKRVTRRRYRASLRALGDPRPERALDRGVSQTSTGTKIVFGGILFSSWVVGAAALVPPSWTEYCNGGLVACVIIFIVPCFFGVCVAVRPLTPWIRTWSRQSVRGAVALSLLLCGVAWAGLYLRYGFLT